jgi:nucleoside-triphosphatase
MAQTLLLTGRPGVGKTTVIKTLVKSLGQRADGFYTQEIRQHGQRQGFELVGLRGERATLAHVHLKGGGRPRVGRYGVDVAALERVGVAALQRAVFTGCIVILDEIGKMELFSPAFKAATLAALDGPAPLVATIMARPHPWADALKAQASVTVWQVTLQNRDDMPTRILAWLEGAS